MAIGAHKLNIAFSFLVIQNNQLEQLDTVPTDADVAGEVNIENNGALTSVRGMLGWTLEERHFSGNPRLDEHVCCLSNPLWPCLENTGKHGDECFVEDSCVAPAPAPPATSTVALGQAWNLVFLKA